MDKDKLISKEVISFKELAAILGISRTTVSRVLTGQAQKYRISAKTQAVVRDAAAQYNVQANQVAKNLKLQKTNTVGLLIPDISNPFFANLALQAELALRKADKMLVLCNTNDDTNTEQATLDLLLARQIDGLLVAPVGIEVGHFQAAIGRPMVFIDRYFPDHPVPYAATDNKLGAQMATQYLLEKGHQQIVCIQGLEHTISNQERVRGFQAAMQQAGYEAAPVSGDEFSIANGYRSFQQLLQQKVPFTAVFALSSQIAIGILEAARDAGLRVPEDFSLICFDEQPYLKLTNPPITTIQQPIDTIGQRATAMLLELIAGRSVDNQLFPPSLIERSSVAPLSST
ncbi:MAG: LacI family DNA-binding transcriptional regulator [Bacteroidota bacterium]